MSQRKNICIVGCNGAIGRAFTEHLSIVYPDALIHAFSRDIPQSQLPNVQYHIIDYQSESSIEQAASVASKDTPLDLVIVATGVLHNSELKPEKSLKELSADKFQMLFQINTIFPALVIKHFLPKLNKDTPSQFGILSARPGSISDNQMGGWYAYRASKAALNMVIKNAAIEIARTNKNAVIVGLHPGVVDSSLSKPFQASVPPGKLFTPLFAAENLLKVLNELTPEKSGYFFAWDGEEIAP